jgi:hypothetical protein
MKWIKHALAVGAVSLALLAVLVGVIWQTLDAGLFAGLILLASSPIALIVLLGTLDELVWMPRHPCHYCVGLCSFPRTESRSSFCDARAKE